MVLCSPLLSQAMGTEKYPIRALVPARSRATWWNFHELLSSFWTVWYLHTAWRNLIRSFIHAWHTVIWSMYHAVSNGHWIPVLVGTVSLIYRFSITLRYRTVTQDLINGFTRIGFKYMWNYRVAHHISIYGNIKRMKIVMVSFENFSFFGEIKPNAQVLWSIYTERKRKGSKKKDKDEVKPSLSPLLSTGMNGPSQFSNFNKWRITQIPLRTRFE